MRRLHQMTDGTVFETDDDALDDNGVLKDGYKLRVPMQFRDSNRGIADAPRLRFADGRTDVPVGSRPGFIVDAGDGERIRYEAYLASVRELNDAWKQTDLRPAGTYPHSAAAKGAACTIDTAPLHPISAADAQAIRDAAYEAYVEELTNAWRRT
jgi:hypothetical protein